MDAGIHGRALGAYLGLAVGDALGATVEFLTAGEIRQRHGQHRELTGGGWLKLRPGQVTDDTQMSLALGAAILADAEWNLKTVADAYLAWFRSKPVDVGNTCRRGIVRYLHEGTLVAPPSEGDGGNGACMRNLPVALHTLGDDAAFERRSLEQARFTHNHPLSDAATLALGRMTQALILGEPAEAARALADQLVARQRCFRFERAPRSHSPYIVDTVQTVLHVFFDTASFEDCLLRVVNLGGDADTTGALAGMLAGARQGVEAIPARWLRRLDARTRARVETQTAALLARCGH